MTRRVRRSRRKPQMRRRIAYVAGGIATAAVAATTVVRRRLRPKHDETASNDSDRGEPTIDGSTS